MPYQSKWKITPPDVSLPSFIFGSSRSKEHLFSGDRVFLDTNSPDVKYFSLASYREWSKRLALGLSRVGFGPGDRLMLFSGNSIFTPVVAMGTIMAGGIYNSANPGFTVREVAYQMKDCEPSIILAAPNCIEKALEAFKTLSDAKATILLFDDSPLTNENAGQQLQEHWSTLLANPEDGQLYSWEKLDKQSTTERTALLAYSSGTTGLPKGVEITHYQLVCNILQIKEALFSDENVVRRVGLCALPFYHGLGLLYYGLMAPKFGVKVYVMERYSVDQMLKCIDKFGVTELLLVPPMVVAMAKHSDAQNGKSNLRSVGKVVVGAAPLGREITEQFEQLWHGKVKVRQGWGMSEVPAISLAWDECDAASSTSTSVGELLGNLEAKVMDDNDQEIREIDKPGELWVRGPNVMKGYWRKPVATAEMKTSDGWLKTGDIAYPDKNGKWYIVDRKKELIKVRGAQVAPAELEALLLEHPQIVDAAVVGVKTASGDEEPRAYVVRRNDRMLSESDVEVFVRKRVAKQKQLCGGVSFVETVPRTAAGKILRRTLRDQAAKECASSSPPQARL